MPTTQVVCASPNSGKSALLASIVGATTLRVRGGMQADPDAVVPASTVVTKRLVQLTDVNIGEHTLAACGLQAVPTKREVWVALWGPRELPRELGWQSETTVYEQMQALVNVAAFAMRVRRAVTVELNTLYVDEDQTARRTLLVIEGSGQYMGWDGDAYLGDYFDTESTT